LPGATDRSYLKGQIVGKQHYCHIHFDDDVGWMWCNQGDQLLKKEETQKLLTESEIEAFEKWLGEEFLSRRTCPNCRTALHVQTAYAQARDDDLVRGPGDPSVGKLFGAAQDPGDSRLWVCPNCYFWQWHCAYHTNLFKEWQVPDYFNRSFAVSQLAAFNPKLPAPCPEELAQHLRRNPRAWHTIRPRALEKLVRDVFKANYGDCEVKHVGQPGDGGIDVLMVRTDKKRWLISVKRREREEKGEPVSTLRDLIGAMVLEDGAVGVVASTANHFTTAARKAVRKASAKGVTIKLIDKGDLNLLIGGLLPPTPWRDAIVYTHPGECEEIVRGLGSHRLAASLEDVLKRQ
jgi:Restriction endonuclease